MAKRRHGDLSDEDRALWRRVSDDARPLSRRAELRSGTAMAIVPEAHGRQVPAPPPKPRTASFPDHAATRRRGQGQGQGRGQRRGRGQGQGRIQPDSRLDLHGLTQAAAHARLDRFLAEAGDRGDRCILVITGKGSAAGSAAGPGELDAPFMRRPGSGILRALVPAWLGEGDHRGRVLSHQPAHPRDGGAGALYVFLRRRRVAGGGPGR